MTDEQINEFALQNLGFITENPWKIELKNKNNKLEEDDLDTDRYVSLDKYTEEEKLNDADYVNLDDL